MYKQQKTEMSELTRQFLPTTKRFYQNSYKT